MKICTYCGTECEDSIRNCPSCGANRFDNICGKCGTRFATAFCPTCGTKAGTVPKQCKRCGTVYFSKACPDCGYIEIEQNRSSWDEQQFQDEIQKKNTERGKKNLKVFGIIEIIFTIFFMIVFASIVMTFFNMFFNNFW